MLEVAFLKKKNDLWQYKKPGAVFLSDLMLDMVDLPGWGEEKNVLGIISHWMFLNCIFLLKKLEGPSAGNKHIVLDTLHFPDYKLKFFFHISV